MLRHLLLALFGVLFLLFFGIDRNLVRADDFNDNIDLYPDGKFTIYISILRIS